MASPSPGLDIEAQAISITETQPAIIPNSSPATNTVNNQLPTAADPQPQSTSINEHNNGNAGTKQTVDHSEVQHDENHGDSSDGIWSMYVNEAEKQDTEVIESWKGDTDGILVFTGLFSATVASFITESYQSLSPDSSDTTNALLTQISQQLVNISNGTPLTSIVPQSDHPFKPTASAVRVNVLWFLSLILSLSCALSATLMQQWARRYQELARRRGAFHRRARMRAYIFDGINSFGMTRAVATMPTLLHISVFFFFAGLIDFLFPIYATVAYATFGCIGVFALAYAILTVLPNIYLNCPYSTPLSGFTWHGFQFSAFGFLWTILTIDVLFRNTVSNVLDVANQRVMIPHRLKMWRESLEMKVKIHRQWFSQSLRRSVEIRAYRAESRVITSALEWTLTILDEEKEIEDFTARVPGFFDSRADPDATSAVLSLMSHQPNTDPIFGSRLCDLLEICIPGTSLIDDKARKCRMRVCLNCLWHFGRAYNQPGVSQLLPSFVHNSLLPEITRRVQIEEDSTIRVMGRCVVAVIINKFATDLNSRTILVNDELLSSLSSILGTKSYDLQFLLLQPGSVALANMISFGFGEVGTFVADEIPPDVLDMVKQTLAILSQGHLSLEDAELQVEETVAVFRNSNGKFERILVSRLFDLLNTCIQVPSPLTEGVRMSSLRMCLTGLWYFGQGFNWLGNSAPLPLYICAAFTPELIRGVRQHRDLAIRVIGRCVGAMVVNKLAANLNSRADPFSEVELRCLSVVLGIKGRDVDLFLRQPGAVSLSNHISLFFDDAGTWVTDIVPSDVLGIVQQTFTTLSPALSTQENVELQPEHTTIIQNGSYKEYERILVSQLLGTLNTCIQESSSLPEEVRTRCLRMCLKGMWYFGRAFNQLGNSVPLPSYICAAFTPEMICGIQRQHDLSVRLLGRCVWALVVSKLAANLNSLNNSIKDVELECLSAIFGDEGHSMELLLRRPGAVALSDFISLVFDEVGTWGMDTISSDVLDVVQKTLPILSRALSAQERAELQLEQTIAIFNGSNGKFGHILVPRLLELINTCIRETSLRPEELRTSCLRMCLKGLWHLTKEYNERGNSMSLPSYVYVAFNDLEMTHYIRQKTDLATRMIGRCVEAFVVNKLTADIRLHSASNAKLACLSAILGTRIDDVKLLLRHPHAIDLQTSFS